jgi:DNA-binding NarL/FixJ family response regulator
MIARTLDTSSPAARPTLHESLLTWLILTLLNTRDMAHPARPATMNGACAHSGGSPYASLLTAREIEVLRLVTIGLTNGQIAAQLFVSRRTVDQHVTSIYSRLGVSCRAAATRLAMLNELCP